MRTEQIIEKNQKCPYFNDKIATTHYKIIDNCSKEKYYQLLIRGYRRFGKVFFNPICTNCTECKTIRVLVDEFTLTKSYKRVLNKNKDIKIIIQKPSLSIKHLNLHNRYHQFMTNKKNWDNNILDGINYYLTYVDGANNFGYEMLLLKDGKLIGVGLFDVVKNSISAVYSFYEPTMQKNSLGKFIILSQINLAKKYNLKYWYPGYWIKDHYSMGYKEEFKPFEILTNRPTLNEKCLYKLFY